ncbi:uncharacterized protein LOC135682818 [Rhopilema esculentum]|uniref:uncharacterized protein LOC135682818 n=1 Tax=Rhopilema esculentum TaxID=499914 RepID=UPI0031D2020F
MDCRKFVLLFVFILAFHSITTHGFPGSCFIARLSRERTYKGGAVDIDDWDEKDLQEMGYRKGQGFKVKAHGVYVFGYTVNAEESRPGSIQACINVNNGADCEALLSEFSFKSNSEQGKNISLHATGLMRLFDGDFVSVRVVSSVPWRLRQQSNVFGYMLHEYGMASAFYVTPSSANPLLANQRQLVRSWDVARVKGSFLSAPSLSINLGVFSVLQSGLYFIGLHVVIRKSSEKEIYMVTIVSGNVNLMKRKFGVDEGVETITLSLNALVNLDLGNKLYIHVKKHGKSVSSILPSSSYSVGLLRESTLENHGFNLKSFVKERLKPGSKPLDLSKFTAAHSGGFDTMKKEKYVIEKPGTYLICVNLEVYCSNAPSCTFSFSINEHSLLNSVRNLHHIQASTCRMLFMYKGTYLSFKIRSKNEWYLIERSSISMALLQEIFPAFSLSSAVTSYPSPAAWIKVSKLSVNDHDFTLSSGFNGEDFIISRSGIYKVFTNLIFTNLKQAAISACVAVDGDLSSPDGLFATNSAVSGKHTLTISSAIYLQKKQRLAVFVKSKGRENWNIDKNSSISLIYLGERELIIGFQTTLLDHNTYTSIGWRTPSNWNKPKYMASKPWSFASKRGPSMFGSYKVPADGLYYISTNIIIGKANLIDDRSFFIGMISINDQTDSYLPHTKQSNKLHTSQNDVVSEFTLSISTALSLKTNDSISVKICSKSDVVWMIRKESGFSVILLSEALSNPSPNGFLARYINVSTKVPSQENIGNWTIVSNNNIQFSLGDSLKISGDEILVKRTGMFAILINIQLKENIGEEIELALIDVSLNSKKVCLKSTRIYKEAFAVCNLLLILFKGTRLKISLMGPLENHLVIFGPASTLSVYKIERPKAYPWLFAELQENIQPLSKLNIDSWMYKKTQKGRLLGHDGLTRTSDAREVLLVTANFVFDQVTNGKCTVAISDAFSNKTHMELTSHYNASSIGQATLSFSRVIESSPGRIRQTIDAQGFFISKTSSFSITRLPILSNGQRFSLNMDVNQSLSKTGRLPLRRRAVSNAKTNELLNRDSAYIITVTLAARLKTNYLSVLVETAGGEILMQRMLSKQTDSLNNYIFSGICIPKTPGKVRVSVQGNGNDIVNITRQSNIQVTSIGDNLSHRVVLPFKASTIHYVGTTSMIKLNMQPSLNQNGIIVAEDTVFIRRTGIYLVSLAVLITSFKRLVYTVCLMVSGDKKATVYAVQEIFGKGTISIMNSMYLQRGMYINTFITVSRRASFEVMPGSTLSIVQIKDLDFNVDEKLLPVIYKDILPPGNHSLPLGRPFSLTCYSIADDKIIYNWFRNGNLAQSSYSPVIKIDGQLHESGEYYCETMASGTIIMSKPVKIGFYDEDECLAGAHTCTGPNQTCINLPGTYKCDCDSGLFMRQGKCNDLAKKTKTETAKMDKLNLPVAVVVLAPIAICVFIFLIVVALYTCYKTRKAATQRLIRHSGSFSDQRQLHREDDTLSSLHNRSSEAANCVEETLEMQELNFQMSNKELKEVRFSLQTDCDFDENLEIQDEGSWKDDGYLSPRTI